MRKSLLVGLGFVAGLMVAAGCRPLFEAPKVQAQAATGKWEHKTFIWVGEYDKILKDVDAGGWEFSFMPEPRAPVFKRLKK